MRRSFTLLLSITLLIIFSSIVSITLSISSETAQTTSKVHLFNRAKLLGRSATEVGLLAVGGYNFKGGNCLEKLNLNGDDLFTVEVYFNYIGYNCKNSIIKDSELKFNDSNGTVLIDVFVESKANNIRFHRRTFQKP